MLEHYARITMQRELIDALWKVQAVKLGLVPDTSRFVVQAFVDFYRLGEAFLEMTDAFFKRIEG